MSAPSRSALFVKLHKVLKKHYQPVMADPERPVLEHLLLACCLENAHYQTAEDALAALVHTFFDWNEIRVSTIRELSEVMSALPDPPAAASRTKRVLQHVFERSYSFDLEELRKSNLGPAIESLRQIDGTTPFTVAYVVQSALGGHSTPIDEGVLKTLQVVGLASDEDCESGTVAGLERAISKNKGIEFASLLHQLGADFTANCYAPALHAILLQINPDAKEQLPKRRRKTQPARGRQSEAEPAAGEDSATQNSEEAASKTTKSRRKSKPAEREGTASAAGKKRAAGKDQPASVKKGSASNKSSAEAGDSKKSPGDSGISKRKPR